MVNQYSSASRVTSASIDIECTDKFTVDTLHNSDYLRRDAFGGFLRPDRVSATIEKEFHSCGADEKQKLVRYSLENPRVFLTLASTSLIKKMPLLCSGKFRDDHLPVQRRGSKTYSTTYSVAGHQGRPWQCFTEGEDGDGDGDGDGDASWDTAHVKQFVSNQWLFSAVVFENDRFNYQVHRDCPLPYISLKDTATAGGGYGKVFKLGLQARHLDSSFGRYLRTVTHETLNVTVHEVAVKQLRVAGATSDELQHFFEREVRTLETMRGLRHPHLIEAISAYSKGPDRCFVFPWARGGNLRQLWEGATGPAGQETTHWAFRQIRGLADGLERLHANGTRHGDLKPENILIFDGDDGSGQRPLVIADVGIAKFHAEETRQRQAQGYLTTNKSGTLRYEPPEIELSQRTIISRRYDSWSLGCIILEFIVWLVRGPRGQDLFHHDRLNIEPKLDRFWHRNPNQEPGLHPAVAKWITKELPGDLAPGTALRDLLDLVARCLLVGPVDDRASIEDFCSELQHIHHKCSDDSSYLWNASDTELTRRRNDLDVAEVANGSVVPISQRRTSTLVDKWETVTNPSLVRELTKGLEWTQWPGTRRLAASPCRLCGDCAAVNFTSQSYELRKSLQDLHESAGDCALCGFLDRRLSALRSKPREPLKLVRVGARIQVYPIDRPIISLYCDPVSGIALPALPFAQIGLPLLPDAASREQFALLNLLVHHCDKEHECMAVQEQPASPAKLPTRVIDVGRDAAGPIRLVETSQEPTATCRYVALSHRWGDLSREQRCCTYADNIAQRTQRIGYDELPASFQDAVRVTRALGVSYLWIDSLCIIQEDPDDWAAEAGMMEDVFSHAYCTIAASSASSSLAGFLGDRRPRDAIMLPTPGGAPLYLAEDVDDFRADVEGSVLSSRGWVLQERALSRRTIYFTSTQVYWECGNGVVCETLAQLRNPQSRFLGDSSFPSFGLQFYKDERIRLVQHFYSAYSALGLSHASDRSQAVAGLQRRIARAFGSEASHGVLWRWPGRTLLWRAARPRSLARIDYRRRGGAEPTTTTTMTTPQPPPSWSWMAYDGRIAFMDVPFAGVEWTGNVQAPGPAGGGGRVSAEASRLCVGGEELTARAVLDARDAEFVEGSWKCVVVGKEKGRQEDEAAHYVLLIRPVSCPSSSFSSSSGPSDDVYERVGVATLLASHFVVETSSIFIV